MLHGLSVFQLHGVQGEVVQVAWQPCTHPLQAAVPLYVFLLHNVLWTFQGSFQQIGSSIHKWSILLRNFVGNGALGFTTQIRLDTKKSVKQ